MMVELAPIANCDFKSSVFCLIESVSAAIQRDITKVNNKFRNIGAAVNSSFIVSIILYI